MPIKRPRNAPSMSSFKSKFYFDPLKATKKRAKYCVTNCPLDLRPKKINLMIKLTKLIKNSF